MLDVFGNAFEGELPPLTLGPLRLEIFNVDRNNFTGPFPELRFDDVQQCDILHADGGNRFSCPWPANVTARCRRYDGAEWVAVTDADCAS